MEEPKAVIDPARPAPLSGSSLEISAESQQLELGGPCEEGGDSAVFLCKKRLAKADVVCVLL